MPDCGTVSSYNTGCHCERCKRAMADYKRERKPLKPCRRCGGPKKPPLKQGQAYCETCIPLVKKEAAERRRQKARERYRRLAGPPKPRGKFRMVIRKMPKQRKRKPQTKKPAIPLEIRAAWDKAHPNSIIRQKCPNLRALERWWRNRAA